MSRIETEPRQRRGALVHDAQLRLERLARAAHGGLTRRDDLDAPRAGVTDGLLWNPTEGAIGPQQQVAPILRHVELHLEQLGVPPLLHEREARQRRPQPRCASLGGQPPQLHQDPAHVDVIHELLQRARVRQPRGQLREKEPRERWVRAVAVDHGTPVPRAEHHALGGRRQVSQRQLEQRAFVRVRREPAIRRRQRRGRGLLLERMGRSLAARRQHGRQHDRRGRPCGAGRQPPQERR
ncbi:hypothetical protein K2Z84_03670, partial [Candidatus Binatia bacterium]|nr:hypothetical protein [Candidatus Binatia bacterium]